VTVLKNNFLYISVQILKVQITLHGLMKSLCQLIFVKIVFKHITGYFEIYSSEYLCKILVCKDDNFDFKL
jgi:hypothetical protein